MVIGVEWGVGVEGSSERGGRGERDVVGGGGGVWGGSAPFRLADPDRPVLEYRGGTW